jgi:DNA-binding transcriptional LysR family regulator
MELRQLHYFVTLAEELHFGRAAAREHIVQSGLSQQISRLERELGVELVRRSTHHVALTAAGEALLVEARIVLRSVERATTAAHHASVDTGVLRVSVLDASLDSMPQVLRNVQYNHPNLVIHRLETPVPAQYRMLAQHSLDVGIGYAAHAPAGIATEVFRLDAMGVLLAEAHPLARADSVPVSELRDVPLVLAEDDRAPEVNAFVTDICATAGFRPTRHPDSVQSIRAAAYLVREHDCVALVPSSCDLLMQQVRWIPLSPECRLPWSLLWREGDDAWPVRAVRRSARALAGKLDWLPARPDPGAPASPAG